jgi:hypothetical protein
MLRNCFQKRLLLMDEKTRGSGRREFPFRRAAIICHPISTTLSYSKDNRGAAAGRSKDNSAGSCGAGEPGFGIGAKKIQGYKTRAPEGMSILAFLGISPFQRLLIPLTPINHNRPGKMVKIFLDKY